MDWRLVFPEVEVFSLPAVGSDHNPLIIQTPTTYKRHNKPFHFEAHWNDEVECREIISKVWNSHFAAHLVFIAKVQKVITALSKWSCKKFSNGHARVMALKQQLQDLTNQQNFTNYREVASTIREEIKKTWQMEEQYWQ